MENHTPAADAALCYQCGKCTASCPAAPEMTMPPHRAMHLLALGREDRLRGENTVWMCASCFTCAMRCPNDIDIPGLFDDLRSRWRLGGGACARPEALAFHTCFLRDVKRRGRVHELRMMGEYNLAVRAPFRNAVLALRLFAKRRLRLLPPRRVRGFRHWVKQHPGKSGQA